MENTLDSKDFLTGKNGEFWIKNQIILHYPQPISRQEVLAQVKERGQAHLETAKIQVKALNPELTAYLVTTPGIHNWAEAVMIKVHNPPPLPPPPPPILPDDIIKNKLWLKTSGTKVKVLTTAETLGKR